MAAVPDDESILSEGLLSAFEVLLQIGDHRHVRPRHLRALVANWIERGWSKERHRGHVKPYTVAPLAHVEGDVWALRITTLSSAAATDLLDGVAVSARSGIHLGNAPAAVHPEPRIVGRTDFRHLLRSADEDGITLEFHTPTTFRRGRHATQPFPIPELMLGHYRTRWNAFCPPDLRITLDLTAARLAVEGFRLHSGRLTDGFHTARGFVDRLLVGFVGQAGLSSTAGPDMQRRISALCSLAPFCGTGANTTIGMGVTSLIGPEGGR